MPLDVSCFSSAVTSTLYFFANPAAAGVGPPSGLNAALAGGPVTTSSSSVCRSARRATRAVSRRGVLKLSMGAPGARRYSFNRASRWRLTWLVRPGSQLAGISSHPISISSSRSIVSHVSPGDAHGELPHAKDIGRALGHADTAARVENVEGVRALQAVLERGPHQSRGEQPVREAVILVEQVAVQRRKFRRRHVDLAERVLRLLDFLLQPHLAVLDAAAPLQVVHVVDPLQEHGNALEPVRDLAGDRREVEAADLLEVRELGDLEPVEHHLPADAPGAERGRFPIVFLEPDVVLARVDPARLEAVEIELLDLVGRRLEDHLELVMLEQAIRVLSEAAVVRPS